MLPSYYDDSYAENIYAILEGSRSDDLSSLRVAPGIIRGPGDLHLLDEVADGDMGEGDDVSEGSDMQAEDSDEEAMGSGAAATSGSALQVSALLMSL